MTDAEHQLDDSATSAAEASSLVPEASSSVRDASLSPDAATSPTVSETRRWLRRAVRGSVVVCAVSFVYLFVSFLQVRSVGGSDQARRVDAIVVLGAAQYDGRPSPQLQARLDHVVQLWDQGLAPLVFVTGGNQPGDRFTEASASAKYLIAHGVAADAIAQEDQAHSSYESLRTVARILSARNAHRVLLVSDPYHSLRIRLVAQELGLTAYVSPTRTSPVRGATALSKQIKEAVGVSVGRIIGFDNLFSLTG